jgi:HPt (histidine-containing phosphotransfer) domain-containing protein
MNDYIAKPIDERLLYSKIVGIVKPSVVIGINNKTGVRVSKKLKKTNLDYLNHLTKSDPALMMEMISAYLIQTPALIKTMKQSLKDKDWDSLHAAVHKMIPSFSIMGISADFESMAKKVQEYSRTKQQTDELPDLVLQLEIVCKKACKELKEEFNTIKNADK